MKKCLHIVIFIIAIFLPTYAYSQGLGNGSSAGGPLTNPKIITSILDTNGNTLLGFTATASAVNYSQYANGAAGSSPSWTAMGSDTDIGELHITKALGNFVIQPGADQSDTLDILTAAGGHAVRFGTYPGVTTYGGMWSGNASQDNTNYVFIGNGTTELILNAPTTAAALIFRLGQTITQMTLTSAQMQLGASSATPVAQLLKGPNGVGSNIAGGNLTVAGGYSTGSAAGGSFIVQTTAASGSSSTTNTPTTRVTIDSTGLALFTDKISSSRTTDLGWVIVAATNQACNTTCTSAAVFGFDVVNGLVNPTDATADQCLCAGAS